jgi:RNA polymerase sigma factor (sigma-70 family)
MEQTLELMTTERTRKMEIDRTIRAERQRLLDFIRSRVRLAEDAEDIVQDVLYQFVVGDDILGPIEKTTSWLFTVARNRIIDWYRKRRPEAVSNLQAEGMHDEDDEREFLLESRLFDPAGTPDDVYFRSLVWDELADALEELPDAQRQVFVMHELEGKSFKEIADETGVGVATLLSRKRYAVAFLRERLRELYDELNG